MAHICHHPHVQQAHTFAQRFQAMVHQRLPEHVDSWLADGMASGIPELCLFARTLQQEYTSIRAALTEPWSTGHVEGQINRLKSIKRPMYGRASLNVRRNPIYGFIIQCDPPANAEAHAHVAAAFPSPCGSEKLRQVI